MNRYVTSSLTALCLVAGWCTVAQAAPAPAGKGAVTRFVLINVDNHEELQELTDGAIINLRTLPTRNLNVRVETSGSVSRVDFQYDRQKRYRSERSVPFSLAGDKNGRYRSWTPKVGDHLLVATPFTGRARGEGGKISFRVIDEAVTLASISAPPTVPPPPPAPAAQEEVKLVSASVPVETSNVSQSEGSLVFPLSRTGQENTDTLSVESFGKCVTFLDHSQERLTIGCSYTPAVPASISVIDGKGKKKERKLCDLGVLSSPLVASCSLSDELVSRIEQGEASLRIRHGEKILEGRIPRAVFSTTANMLPTDS